MPGSFSAGEHLLPAAIIFGLTVTFIITPFVRRLSFAAGVVDIPRDGRRMHKSAVPLAGGAGMIAAFLFSLAVFGGQGAARPFPLAVFCFLCGVYGLLDDKYALPAFAKLALQLSLGLCASLVLGRAEAFSAFGYTCAFGAFSVPATALWVAFMMNAVNLTDGMDGLCAGTSAVSAACLSILLFLRGHSAYALFAAALAGACLGFLFHNRAPAKIFMGETGSAFLGFALAVLSLPLFSAESCVPLPAVLPAFLLPLCEAAGSFMRRAERGKNPFAPDKEHMHHVLFARLGSAPAVCAVMYVLALVGAIAALIYERAPAVALLLLAAATVCMRLMLSRTSTLSLRRRREPRAECRGRQGQRRAR